MLTIRGATVYAPGGPLSRATVTIVRDHIVDVTQSAMAPRHGAVIHAEGLLLIPGLIDLQCNGILGHDVLSATTGAILAISSTLPRFACTSVLPTLVTCEPNRTLRGLAAIAGAMSDTAPGAAILGTHMEGPWLSPLHHGAHPRNHVRPFNGAEWQSVQRAASGTLRMVTLAPEAFGNAAAVSAIVEAGAVASIGHSGATYDDARAAEAQGARMVTHIFNAMSALHHRAPGLPGAALDIGMLTPGLIPDGYHVHPAVIRLVARVRGRDGLVIVTDSAPAAGQPPGTYDWSGRTVVSDGETVRFPDGGLAASGLTPIEAMRRFISITGWPLEDALPGMTSTPAGLLGLTDRGSVVSGGRADLVLLTPALEVHTTFVAGQVAFSREQARVVL